MTKFTVFCGERSTPARKLLQQRPGRLGRHIDREVVAQRLGIVERPDLGLLFDEEVERIVDRHVGDEIDLDLEFGHRLGEDVAAR